MSIEGRPPSLFDQPSVPVKPGPGAGFRPGRELDPIKRIFGIETGDVTAVHKETGRQVREYTQKYNKLLGQKYKILNYVTGKLETKMITAKQLERWGIMPPHKVFPFLADRISVSGFGEMKGGSIEPFPTIEVPETVELTNDDREGIFRAMSDIDELLDDWAEETQTAEIRELTLGTLSD